MINHLQKHHSRAPRDPEVREPIQAEAQLEAEAEIWNEPIEPEPQAVENTNDSPKVASEASGEPSNKASSRPPNGHRPAANPNHARPGIRPHPLRCYGNFDRP
jgi:hypothetical protein